MTHKSVHLMGICGTGMGSFAGLLKAAGYDVRGSDENVYPPMSDKLAAWGIEVRSGYRPENLEPAPDLVIVGNVIRRTNPEAQAVVERGLEYTSFPKALGELFLKDRHSIVVAGTHGKTTTSSMMAWVLTSAGRDPGMLIGGVPGNFDEGFRLGEGPDFVVEGDEYDTAYFDKVPKFVHYHPKSAIITSIEFDHADIYDSVETIEAQFDRLVALVPTEGVILACASDPRVMARLQGARSEVETYSARPGATADWTARDIRIDEEGTHFVVHHATRGRLGEMLVPLAGVHNAENALAVIALAIREGLSVESVREGLKTFQGVARRQTVRAEVDGIRIIDDFAHHPTAVRETVSAIRARYPSGRLFAIFEPRTATSSRAYFQEDYARAFSGADEVIIAQVGRPEIEDKERLDIGRLAEDIAKGGTPAQSISAIDEIVSTLVRVAKSGDTLLFMSNGAFGGIYDKIEHALRARSG